jgi:hypothetical protein
MNSCPVCTYDALPFTPTDYNICPCCGTEFGVDDTYISWEELRDEWVANGAPWFFGEAPAGWNATLQLAKTASQKVIAGNSTDSDSLQLNTREPFVRLAA